MRCRATFIGSLGQLALRKERLKLIVFDEGKEIIVEWINWNATEKSSSKCF